MKHVVAIGKRVSDKLVKMVGKARPGGKLGPSRLPSLLLIVPLALSVGWVGGMWATRPITREGSPPIAQEISRSNKVESSSGKAFLGVRGRDFHQAAGRGVKILAVFPESPAAQAGLRSDADPSPNDQRLAGGSTGHIIVGANGRPIRSEEDLRQLLAHSRPGDVVEFLVISANGNAYEVVPVTLGSAPETLPAGGVSTQKTVPDSSPEREVTGRKMEEEVWRALNQARRKNGLTPLKPSRQLQLVARRHSEEMARRHFFDHRNPEGQDLVERLRAEGIAEFAAAGENILLANSGANLPQMTVQEWLRSPEHRKNLLNPGYTETGVGIAGDGQDKVYVTQVYFKRRNP